MREFIVTCGCGETDEFAKNAFRLLFPNTDCPKIIRMASISRNPKILEFVKALEKSGKAYAYYFKEDDELEVWDLMKGVRVK